MSPIQAQAVQLVALEDEAYFGLDAARSGALKTSLAQLVRDRRGQRPPPGTPLPPVPEALAIGTPKRLDLATRDTFPMLLAAVRTGQREWEVHARQNRLVLLSNLNTAIVDAIAPLDAGRRMPVYPPSKSGPLPDAINARAGAAEVADYNLLSWFPRDTLPGRVAVTLVEYDRISNTVVVDVSGPKAAVPSRRPPQRISGQATPAPADAMQEARATFTLPAVVPANGPATLTAALRLPRSGVTAVAAPAGSPHPLVLAGAVLLVKLDAPTPELVHLMLPARPTTLTGDVEAVESHFAVDLRALAQGRNLSGAYVAYLVVGAVVSGPQTVSFPTQ